jgi:hypothetical protein
MFEGGFECGGGLARPGRERVLADAVERRRAYWLPVARVMTSGRGRRRPRAAVFHARQR